MKRKCEIFHLSMATIKLSMFQMVFRELYTLRIQLKFYYLYLYLKPQFSFYF